MEPWRRVLATQVLEIAEIQQKTQEITCRDSENRKHS
jgi:hypothetical protein